MLSALKIELVLSVRWIAISLDQRLQDATPLEIRYVYQTVSTMTPYLMLKVELLHLNRKVYIKTNSGNLFNFIQKFTGKEI